MMGRGQKNGLAIIGAALITALAAFLAKDDSLPPVEDTGLPRLVDVGGDECEECKKLNPILEELRDEFDGQLTVELIDGFDHPEARETYDVVVIPTQILFDADGVEVWKHEGGLSKEELVAVLVEEVGVEAK